MADVVKSGSGLTEVDLILESQISDVAQQITSSKIAIVLALGIATAAALTAR